MLRIILVGIVNKSVKTIRCNFNYIYKISKKNKKMYLGNDDLSMAGLADKTCLG